MTAALIVEDLACARGGRIVFAGLDLALEAGGAVLVGGPNGSGKTSLLRLLAGLGTPLAGRITRPDRTAMLGHQDAVKAQETPHQALAFWATFASRSPRPAAAADAALAAFGLEPLANLPGRVLSAGQRRRLALARLLVLDAALWLLDEPTLGLDTSAIARLEATLAAHRAAGGMVVLATHVPIALPGAKTLRMEDFPPPAVAA